MYFYCYVDVFLLLCRFRSRNSVSLCCSVYCLCINVYCTAATGCQPGCSYQNISYPVLSYVLGVFRTSRLITPHFVLLKLCRCDIPISHPCYIYRLSYHFCEALGLVDCHTVPKRWQTTNDICHITQEGEDLTDAAA